MRRQEKEISEKNKIEAIIKKARSCRIALCSDNIPYIVPVHFGYLDNVIYVHSASEGKKIDILKQNNKVCVQMDINIKIIPSNNACNWHTKYQSVIGFGRAEIIEDNNEKVKALNIIMDHYASGKNAEFKKEKLNNLAIIKIRLDSITGKNSD